MLNERAPPSLVPLPDGTPWDAAHAFEALFEHSPVGMAMVSLSGQLLRVNAALGDMLGWTAAELVGRATADLTHPDDQAQDRALLPAHRSGECRTHQVEKRYLHRNGRAIWVLLSSTLVADPVGQPLYLIGQVKDITARKTAETALASRHADLQALLDAFPDLHFWLDPDGTIRRYHAGARTYVPPEAFLDRRMQDVLPPEVGHLLHDAMIQALRESSVVQVEYALPLPDGNHWYDARVVPLGKDQSLLAVRDISRRKQSELLLVQQAGVLRDLNSTLEERVRQQTAELAAQQEELRRHLARETAARAEAERTRRRMEDVLDRISDAFVALDRDWRYTYVNAKAAALLGRSRESLLGRHIWTEFPDGIGQQFHRAYERALAEQQPVEIEEYYPPFDRWFNNRIYPSPEGLTIAFNDVTERKRHEEALRHEYALSDSIVNALPGVFYLYDESGHFLRWNRNFLAVTGYSAAEMSQRQPLDFFTGDDVARVRARIADVFRSGYAEVEADFVSRDGRRTPYFFNGVRTRIDGKMLLLGVGIDISARKQAEAEHLDLQRRLARAQEEERRRLSRELHDVLGQLTVGCKLKIEVLRGMLAGNDAALAEFDYLATMADQVGRAAHQIAWELRPAALDDLGLTRTLQAYVRDWSERTGVAIDFQVVGSAAADPMHDTATTVFRVVQEALTNAAKHARAHRVAVILRRTQTEVVVVVEDDGCGFGVEPALKTGRGLGLLGMRERAALVGGTVEIESTVGGGTTVLLRIPQSVRPEGNLPCPASASS